MNQYISFGVAAALAVAGGAQGAIVFSDVNIQGSLSAGASFQTDASGIHFDFPAAEVGDAVDPIRSGNIVITYTVEGTDGEMFADMFLGIAGALSGSGMIFINEIVEDLNSFKVLGGYNAILSDNAQLPYEATFDFSEASGAIKVKKSFVLSAVTTAALDLAQITAVDQFPTPGSASLLAGAGAVLFGVRRRK